MADERPASGALVSALRTGGAAVLLTPFAHYRVTPFLLMVVGIPPETTEAASFMTAADPLVAGLLLGGVSALGTALRDVVYARLNDPSNPNPNAIVQLIAKVLP